METVVTNVMAPHIGITLDSPHNLTNQSQAVSGQKEEFENLFPAVVECFAIICGGYLAGRAHILSSSQAKGLGIFVSKFALPALLFRSMCVLNFQIVNWKFLASILISKSMMFLIVAVISLLVIRPVNTGKAGLYAIFTTQSNDFALGYPIVKAVYQHSHPELLNYIYLIAPISLIFLNPIGFLLLEIQKWKNSPPGQRTSKAGAALTVVKGVVSNPIVFMTALGVIGNFIFHQKVPNYVDNILAVLGQAYSASALFYLGLSMVGKLQQQRGAQLLTPACIILCKTLLLPFVTREIVNILDAGGSYNSTRDLANFGFLYSTFPTAPSVFLYSAHYNIATAVIATGMVACTFLSAPLMFISAQMVTLPVSSRRAYRNVINIASNDVSIVSVICCIWVMGAFVLSRRCRGMPHQFTLCLTVSQLLTALGMILWRNTDVSIPGVHYVQFCILILGIFGARCWVAVISLSLYFLRCWSLCFALRARPFMYIYGIGMPVTMLAILLIISGFKPYDPHSPVEQYGMPQMIISLVVLLLNILVTVVTLVLQQRYDGHRHADSHEDDDKNEELHDKITDNTEPDDKETEPLMDAMQTAAVVESGQGDNPGQGHKKSQGRRKGRVVKVKASVKKKQCSDCVGCSPVQGTTSGPVSIEDLVPDEIRVRIQANNTGPGQSSVSEGAGSSDEQKCIVEEKCDTRRRQECNELIRDYEDVQLPEGIDRDVLKQTRDEFQITRHLVLILLLLVSMCIGFFLCVWRLFHELTSGIYVVIEFLDNILMFGQGLFTFGVYGLDMQMVISPFMKRWRRLIYGAETVHIPAAHELTPETKQICHRFIAHHKTTCINDIVTTKRYRFKTYQSVFCGTDFVDWLMEMGLANEREDAVDYGKQLLIGQVIEHVTKEHHFHDLPYFYRFTSSTLLEQVLA